MAITHIKDNLYLKGEYKLRDLEKTNWAAPVDCPTVFTTYGHDFTPVNWQSCTAINTPDSLNEFYRENVDETHNSGNYTIPYPNLTDSEMYEFGGLTYAIAHLNDAWSVVNGGNHGTSKGVDITNKETADAILKALETPINRANELLAKMRGDK